MTRLLRYTQSEKEFQAMVIELAWLCGWMCHHPFYSQKSSPGWPDLALAHAGGGPPGPQHGRFLVAELKVRGRPLTASQDRWLRVLSLAGVDARIWRESDWREIEAVLKGEREEG